MSNAEQKLEAIIRDLTPSSSPMMTQLTLWNHARALIAEIKADAIAQHDAETRQEMPPRTRFTIWFVDDSRPNSGFAILRAMSAAEIADFIEAHFTGVLGYRTIYPTGQTFYQEV